METTTGGHVTKMVTAYDGNASLDANNLHNVEEPLSKVELYIIMGILSCLSVVGTAGNAIVLYVFSKKKDRLVSTLFILALAFVDFTTCLIVMPYTAVLEYLYFMCRYDIVCKVYQFLITSNIPFSALIMVAIAIDRYLCICHPFLHALNLQRAKIVIIVLAICAIGLGLCVSLMYGVYQTYTLQGVHPNETMGHDIMANLTANASEAAAAESVRSYHKITLLQHGNYSGMESLEKVLMTQSIVRYTGECMPNQIILSSDFQWYFQKFYTAIYLVCLIIVIVLYTLIYKSVLERRTRRMKQKSRSLPMVVQAVADRDTICDSQEETLLTTVNGDTGTTSVDKSVSTTTEKNPSSATSGTSGTGVKPAPAPGSAVAGKNNNKIAKEKEKARRKSTKKDRNHIANLKTAAMLFVVTVVFIVTYFPAFMMALGLIPNNVIIFYLYFANNVANPVIYSFMNKNFRDDCRKLFCRR
jgi:cholecystokinin A receptor